MKKLVIVLLAVAALVLLLPLLSKAQMADQTVTYKIDLVRPDSFFLVETITQGTSSPRPTTQVSYLLVRDTSELNSLRARLIQDAQEAQSRADEYTAKASLLRAQGEAILSAQKQAFTPPAPTESVGLPAVIKNAKPKTKKKNN